ncbi:5'-nucleotidase / UDP-sugar diphosphatase [Methylococcales bacterium]|nr:5'-nucleotidase / UDP-sugar diphosphatase [Methylococcales bacterium]
MTHLTILHSNDLHGRIRSLERIATLAKQIRAEVQAQGGFCALWDAGDAEDSTLFESGMTKGSAVAALLRAAGYDQATLGNSTPMRYGFQVIPELSRRFGQPLLAANMFDAMTGHLLSGLAPFAIRTFGDTQVGIIGVTAPSTIYSVFKGVRVDDPIPLLPDLIAQVRAQGAQTIVLLSHLGFSEDQKVAQQVKGIDLIIGGHSHTELNPPVVVNGTLIAQAGEYGRFLGRLDLEIDASGKIVEHHGTLIPVDDAIAPDADVQSAYVVEQENVRAMTFRVIGELRGPLGKTDDQECATGNLLADALLERVKGAQIALVFAGHWQTGLEAGPLTLGVLNAAIRSTANPARVELTGEQIRHFIIQALKPENSARRPRNTRGIALGWPHVAGLTAHYSPDHPDSIEIWVGDEPLQADRKYCVAGTDLEFWDAPAYPGYLAIPENQIDLEVPIIMPEVIEEYIAHHSPLDPPALGRIKVR